MDDLEAQILFRKLFMEHLIAAGVQSSTIEQALMETMLQLREQGISDNAEEDTSMAWLDQLTGWCGPFAAVGATEPPSDYLDVGESWSGMGTVISWIVDGVIRDTWPMHIDPGPSDELARRMARELIALAPASRGVDDQSE
jgi:hypothetical protein